MKDETTPPYLDLAELPKGETYESTYGKWLDIFRTVATSPKPYIIENCPASWLPLMEWLGACVESTRVQFVEDGWVKCLGTGGRTTFPMDGDGDFRAFVEWSCSIRPELVDALWKVDNEWEVSSPLVIRPRREFNITCNSSFWRPEVKEFLHILDNWEYPHSWDNSGSTGQPVGIVLVPCAADKPYPAPMHKAVLESLTGYIGHGWTMAIVTGVFGVVPMELWNEMPVYDSGLPNEWRVYQRVQQWFKKHANLNTVVGYMDFNSISTNEALLRVNLESLRWTFVNPVKRYCSYLNLMDPKLLKTLQGVVVDHGKPCLGAPQTEAEYIWKIGARQDVQHGYRELIKESLSKFPNSLRLARMANTMGLIDMKALMAKEVSDAT